MTTPPPQYVWGSDFRVNTHNCVVVRLPWLSGPALPVMFVVEEEEDERRGHDHEVG